MEGNIVLAGLVYDENLGDQAIAFSTKEIINRVFDTHGESIEIRYLDLGGATSAQKVNTSESNNKRKLLIVAMKLIKMIAPRLSYSIAERRITKSFYKVAIEKINNDTKAIIFCGGGLIHYKHLFLSRTINKTIEIAEKKHIPVMFSAVGVEGYDKEDHHCLLLKKALNSDVVKIVSTRDDIDCLVSCYITNPNIQTRKVADSVCSISSFISGQKKMNRTIGLGIANPRLFKKYDIPCSEDQFTQLWIDIYQNLTQKGFRCYFFTNGAEDDYEYAKSIVERIDNHIILVQRPFSVDALVNTISSYSAIIATRMHSAIIAFSYDVPAVGIVWNNKQIMFGNSIDRENYFIESKDFNSDTIVQKVQSFLEEGYDNALRDDYIASTGECLSKFLEEYVFL